MGTHRAGSSAAIGASSMRSTGGGADPSIQGATFFVFLAACQRRFEVVSVFRRRKCEATHHFTRLDLHRQV